MKTVAGSVLAGARIMARIGVRELSALSGLSSRTITILESKDEIVFGERSEPGKHQKETVMRVIAALSEAGVEISRDGRGARLAG